MPTTFLVLFAAASLLAQRALAATTDDGARIDWIWQQALQRAPSATERQAALRYLAAAFVVNKRRRNTLKDIIRLIQTVGAPAR